MLASSDAPGELLEGTFRAFVADHADGSHDLGYTLVTQAGEHVGLAFDTPPRLSPGDHIQVAGEYAKGKVATSFRVHEFVKLDDEGELGSARQAIVDGATRTQRVAVVLLDFEGSAPQAFTPADAVARMSEVRAYYQEISYGMLDIESAVFGPYQVPKPTSCDIDTIENLARTAARNQGVAIDSFDHVATTLPSNGDTGLACECGLAHLGRAPAVPGPFMHNFSLYTCTDSNAFAHELGHNFGLLHASSADCQGEAYRPELHTSCTLSEYGNSYNTMGNGLGHMNGYQKATMKWLDRCNSVRVSRDGIYELTPIQLESEALQVLQIATGDTHDGRPLYYYVEYRNPALATFNARDYDGTVREKGPGVHITVGADFDDGAGAVNTVLLDLNPWWRGGFVDPRLTVGDSFHEPYGRVTITLLDAGTDRARVDVRFPGGGSASPNLCGDGSALPGSGGTGAVATLFQDCWYGGWSVSLAPGDYDLADLRALGVLDNDASSLTLREGFEAILYDDPGFAGNTIRLGAANECLWYEGFNDALSSLRIRAVGAP